MNELDKIVHQVFDIVENTWRDEIYHALTLGAQYVYGSAVEGDIAEFGTMTGRTAVALSSAFVFLDKKYGGDTRLGDKVRSKKLWFFDSFAGLPEARFEVDKLSHHVANGIWGTESCKGMTYDQFCTLIGTMVAPEKFSVKEGFFRSTMPEIPTGTTFSLIHIDSDLYESAIDVLDNLFKRNMVSRGAIIFFDDWNSNQADPDFGERRAWREVCETYNITYSDEGSYAFCGHKFIVHSYDS